MNARSEADPTSLSPVLRTVTVGRPLHEAFAVFTDEIGAWWPLPTHGVFGERSGGLRFHDGSLVETAIDGTISVWAEILEWEPPDRFALSWHPGHSDGPSSRVEVSFEPDGDGTRVLVRHDGWEAFGAEGLARRRTYVGPSAWGHVLDHFTDIIEPRTEAIDVASLSDAYEHFFAKAEQGDFGPAPDGEWHAEQVVAHVALNDLAMTAVAQALVHGQEPSFENHTCQDPDHLSAVIEAAGGMDELIKLGRTCAQQMMAAVRRLDAEQQIHPVPCRMVHDGHVVLNELRPWGEIAVDVQAGMHLPAHTNQLEDLRNSV